MHASLIINSTEAYYSDVSKGLPSTASSRWVTDIKTGQSPHGGGGGRWRRRDHRCVTETVLSISSKL